LPPTVQADEEAFYNCFTLQPRVPVQVHINDLTYELQVQKSRETIAYLKQGFDGNDTKIRTGIFSIVDDELYQFSYTKLGIYFLIKTNNEYIILYSIDRRLLLVGSHDH